MTLRLHSIKIQGFRGFNEPVLFDMDADVVLIYGNNGTGKTSVFDALRWCLYGDVVRLRDAEEPKSEATYRNVFCKGNTVVEVALSEEQRFVVISRRMVDGRSEISYSDEQHSATGDEAQMAVDAITPSYIFDSTISLEQGDISRFVNALTPAQRYDSLSRILGLTKISEFREALESETKRVQKLILELESEIGSIERRLSTAKRQSKELTDNVDSILAESGISLRGMGPTPYESSLLSALKKAETDLFKANEGHDAAVKRYDLIRGYASELDDVRQKGASLSDIQEDQKVINQEMERLSEEISEETENVRRVQRKIDRNEEEIATIADKEGGEMRFIRLSIEHLAGPECPVCKQTIDVGRTKRALEQRLTALSNRLMQLGGENESLRHATKGYNELISNLNVSKKAREIDMRDNDQRLAGISRAESGLLENANRAFRKDFRSLTELSTFVRDSLELASKEIDRAENRKSSLERQNHSLRYALELINSDREAKELSAKKNQISPRLEALQRTKAELKAASASSLDAETNVIRDTLARYREEIDADYARLDPHPLFKKLQLSVETSRGKGTFRVHATGHEKTISVRNIFSEAQANGVALCIFLALSIAKRRIGFNTVILDDPVQTMDDMNVLGLVDILRDYVGHRQVIVASPNRDFFRVLSDRLALENRSQLRYSFIGYTVQGPIVQRLESLPPPASLKTIDIAELVR